MPYLNTSPLRRWLTDRDLIIRDLAELTKAHRDGDAWIPAGALKEAIGGRDPLRWPRIVILAEITGLPLQVIVRPGTTIPDWLLDGEDEPQEEKPVEPKKETTAPPRRTNGDGDKRGPKRVAA